MSLPDTLFIFVLALIIFGPKKLPEIGRQLGRLVGEFRRASNEFKFQIEEELRQADFADKRPPQPTIAAPKIDPPEISETSTSSTFSGLSFPPTEAIGQYPNIGQHPNIDSIYAAGLTGSEIPASTGISETPGQQIPGQQTSESSGGDFPWPAGGVPPTITAAVGALARTAIPYAPQATEPSSPAESSQIANPHPAPAQAETAHG